MASSLSNLCNDLAEGIHRIKCKFGRDDKKCGTCGIKYKYWRPQFSEDLEKHFNEENDEEYFPEADVPLLEKLHDFIMIHYFYEKEWKLKNSKSLLI